MKKLFSILPWLLVLAVLGAGFIPSKSASPFAVKELGKLPVWSDGRMKPLDSVARQSLLNFSGLQVIREEKGESASGMDWMAEVLFDPEAAASRPVFLIQHPDLRTLVNLKPEDEKRLTLRQLIRSVDGIEQQADLAASVAAEQRSPFQKEVVSLRQRMMLSHRLAFSVRPPGEVGFASEVGLYQIWVMQGRVSETKESLIGRYRTMDQWASMRLIPPATPDAEWRTVGGMLVGLDPKENSSTALLAYMKMLEAYEKKEVGAFAQAIAEYRTWLEDSSKLSLNKVDAEWWFGRGEWFNRCATLYLIAFLLVLAGWFWERSEPLASAWKLILLVWGVHTILLALRMWIQGRPPVTNLYSSAIFIGWASVLFGIFLDRREKDGIGTAVASVLGFCTLLIAHHLSTGGDTLETLRAVLDSNFWLATHVVVITLGYSATFVSGFLGILYVVRGVWTTSLGAGTAKRLIEMAYGAVCFATLFSFVGTVLGGIWADQSWGRFWGWDPKENGALLIVLWNALLLHLRWGGMVRDRGFMVLAIAGDIVTSLSWFGVNMLGIGLHSYGFMEESFWWLCLFISSQLALIIIGLTPTSWWKSQLLITGKNL